MSGEISQSSLALMLFLSITFGFVAALVYDVFRIRRIAVNIPILPHFEDFFFMLACAAAMSVIFFAQSSGKVRGFAFAGALGGFYIYRKTLGRLIMAASEKIINFVKYIFRKVVLPPINFIKKLLKKAFVFVKGLLETILAKALLRHRRKVTKKLVKAFADDALCGFGGRKYKTNQRKIKKRGKDL